MEEYKEAGFFKRFYRFFELQDFKLSSRSEFVELIVYSLASFLIPFAFHQQIFVGATVNMLLVLAALNLRGIKLLPVILFPSLGVIAGGYLFGGFTIYLVYTLPFIWLGNALIVLAFKYFRLHKKQNFVLTLGIGAAVKTALLFSAAFVLVYFAIIPPAFLVAMGIFQLITALLGGTMAFAVQKIKNTLPKSL